jgi:hypothetical protein
MSVAVSILHIGIIAAGAPAHRSFGAGEALARLDASGSDIPAQITFAITLVFAAFAAWAFSGARILPRLPLLRTGLVAISAIYLLRGLAVLPEGLSLVFRPDLVPPRMFAFSLVPLAIGCLYATGTRAAWRDLGRRVR